MADVIPFPVSRATTEARKKQNFIVDYLLLAENLHRPVRDVYHEAEAAYLKENQQ